MKIITKWYSKKGKSKKIDEARLINTLEGINDDAKTKKEVEDIKTEISLRHAKGLLGRTALNTGLGVVGIKGIDKLITKYPELVKNKKGERSNIKAAIAVATPAAISIARIIGDGRSTLKAANRELALADKYAEAAHDRNRQKAINRELMTKRSIRGRENEGDN